MNAQFRITPKIVRPTTYRTWILPSSHRLGFFHLAIHVRYIKGQTMLIKRCFVITIMVDTIFSTSSQNSLKFPPAFVLFIRLKSGGAYMKFSSQPPFVHTHTHTHTHIYFWLISLYLWLVLVFLFSKVYYGFTPLWHHDTMTTLSNFTTHITIL
jgi:hypothetical protein